MYKTHIYTLKPRVLLLKYLIYISVSIITESRQTYQTGKKLANIFPGANGKPAYHTK